MKMLFFVIAIVIILPNQSLCDWLDGNDLKSICEASSSFEQGECRGYIAAATTAAENLNFCEEKLNGKEIYKISGFGKCPNQKQINIPQEMKLGQAEDIVVKFLRDNPSQLHRPAHDLVQQAIFVAFGLRLKK